VPGLSALSFVNSPTLDKPYYALSINLGKLLLSLCYRRPPLIIAYSAILFQEFDRLLFLAKGGKTVYFGDIGKNSRTLLDYFESNGARKSDDEENPGMFVFDTKYCIH